MINRETKKDVLVRLKRIEGQIRGLQKMVDDERYCIEIINQITAVCRALEQAGLNVMKRHLESCVADSIRTKNSSEKIKELIDSVEKFIK